MNPQDLSPTAQQTSQPQDPLAQLQDIHLPNEIGIWPPAWGWWLLAILIIVGSWVLITTIKRRKARNAYRALAIAELNTVNRTFGEEQNSEFLQAVSVILRRTALSGFGPQFNASLKGEDFLVWLDDQCPTTKQQFRLGVGTVFLSGPYQKCPEFNRSELQRLSVLWIKEHRSQWQRSKKNTVSAEAKTHV